MMQSRRLDPLLRRAQEREDAVARELAERQRAHALQESRLEELRRYLEEYASTQMTAVSPAQLANRRAFLDRLESAVEQQSRNVDLSRQRLEAERARLLLASRDKQVLEQLAASYRAQEQKLDERRSQREMDDLGARRARARQVEGGEGGMP
ncbi:flagellar export protein FliJ [Pseudoxanthomonas taiwanensis]|jgi:flagellar export protein FliJ|uniref:Flagellar FliJ protein n=1 Tax=Pseudoxanthomonas taiwanensis TaxID=176598 RepID=A0A921TEZ2_9GAMM|nr:flagellar export protein FliJ [Pseudoxanthomonas taiwanensis]KAF1688333.1 flagellar export protein FliJ [Pseudoxanthomonas taiwanensis]MBO2467289.1 flagellar export protein FliJ [Xanthomonadaceae bacterium]